MKRFPAVAHQFYPGTPGVLERDLASYTKPDPGQEKKAAIAVIVPHAGYMYSGRVAGETYSRVRIPERVLILGPNHHGQGPAIAIMSGGEWEMPQGIVPIDKELAEEIRRQSPLVADDPRTHSMEHSLEVQVPFLQYFQKNLRITPIMLSTISYATCEELGHQLATAVKQVTEDVLLVASTDMTHYESRKNAAAKDALAIERIMALDPEGLYHTIVTRRITMCGFIPTTVVLVAAKALGAQAAELVRYTDSGEVTGDTSQVVGYAGFVVS